jgi:hypothetical protein
MEYVIWVIRGLSAVKEELVADRSDKDQKFPLTSFVLYYLFGRDSVACDVIEHCTEKILNKIKDEPSDDMQKEMMTFWVIIGLIECGNMQEAEKLLHDFKPKDERLLLALHLGCFYVENLRISSKDQKGIARRISDKIAPRISSLRLKLVDEFKTELLEIQQGKVSAIEN